MSSKDHHIASNVPPGASGDIMETFTDPAARKQYVDALTLTRISIDHAQDMLYWVCPDGAIADVNQTTCDQLGYSRAELLSMNIIDIDPSLTAESYRQAWEELRELGTVRFETQHRTKGGELIPVEVSRHIVIHAGKEYNCAFGRDITERREAELRIQHLNRVLEAIRKVNQLIIRELDPDLLVERACKLLVETRGYSNAWILLTEGALGEARWVEEGLGEAFHEIEQRLKQGVLPLCCLDALVTSNVVTREPFTCGDCTLSDRHQPKEVMTVRLRHDGKSFGYLCVSLPEAFTHLSEERRLFQEVADDIAFALNRIVLKRERDQAVQRRVELSRKILVAQEEERARVSRELHDELGQILTAVHFELDMLGAKVPAADEDAAIGLRQADAMVKDGMVELRRICRGLRPPMLDDLGLASAVKSLVQDFEDRIGLTVTLEVGIEEDEGEGIRSEVAVCVFRVLQESLNNVARHAEAKQVEISLIGKDEELVLRVKDDGRGFLLDGPEAARGFGLQGIRERADLVNAVLEIGSEPGQGTRVCLRLANYTSAGAMR
jgi:PAS domain S-box-containing protein